MKLSIIIPLYNEENNVEGVLKSISNATMGFSKESYEIIIIDAGSTDYTNKLINDYFKGFPVKIVNEEKLYPGAARNRGVSFATGKFILFMDAGIHYEEFFALNLYNIAVNQHLDVVWGNLIRKPNDDFSQILVDLTYSNLSSKVIPAMLIKTDTFKKIGYFKENLRALEDTEYLRRILSSGFHTLKLNDINCYYFDFPQSYHKVYSKWKLYGEHTVYSRLRKNKELVAIVLNIYFTLSIFNKKVRKFIFPIYTLYTLYKFKKKKINLIKKWKEIPKYLLMSFTIDFASYVGLTKGIIRKGFKNK